MAENRPGRRTLPAIIGGNCGLNRSRRRRISRSRIAVLTVLPFLSGLFLSGLFLSGLLSSGLFVSGLFVSGLTNCRRRAGGR